MRHVMAASTSSFKNLQKKGMFMNYLEFVLISIGVSSALNVPSFPITWECAIKRKTIGKRWITIHVLMSLILGSVFTYTTHLLPWPITGIADRTYIITTAYTSLLGFVFLLATVSFLIFALWAEEDAKTPAEKKKARAFYIQGAKISGALAVTTYIVFMALGGTA